MSKPPIARKRKAPKYDGDQQIIDPNDDRLKFIDLAKGSVFQIRVVTSSFLELQTFNLYDTIKEGENILLELMTTMIKRSGSCRVCLQEFSERGLNMLDKVFKTREPQVQSNLSLTFEVVPDWVEYNVLALRLLFRCDFRKEIEMCLQANMPSTVYVQ